MVLLVVGLACNALSTKLNYAQTYTPPRIPMEVVGPTAVFDVPWWLGGFVATTNQSSSWVLPPTYQSGGKISSGSTFVLQNLGPYNITLYTTSPEIIQGAPSYLVVAQSTVQILSALNWVVVSNTFGTSTNDGIFSYLQAENGTMDCWLSVGNPNPANKQCGDFSTQRAFVGASTAASDPTSIFQVRSSAATGTTQSVRFSQTSSTWNRGFIFVENSATLLTADTIRLNMTSGARGLFIQQNADAGSFIIDATNAPNTVSGPQQTVVAIAGNNNAYSMVKLENYARSTTNNANFVVVNYNSLTTAAGIAVFQSGQGPVFWAATSEGSGSLLRADDITNGINIQTKNASYAGGTALFLFSTQPSSGSGYAQIIRNALTDTSPLVALTNNVTVNGPLISAASYSGTVLSITQSRFGVFGTFNDYVGGYAMYLRSNQVSSGSIGFVRLERTAVSDASPLLTLYNSGSGDTLSVLDTTGASVLARIKPSGQIWATSYVSGPSIDLDMYAGTTGAIGFKVLYVAGMANGGQVTTSSTGVAIRYTAQGSDTNVDVWLGSKGTGSPSLAVANSRVLTCTAQGCVSIGYLGLGSMTAPSNTAAGAFSTTKSSPALQAFGAVTANAASGLLAFTVSTAAQTCVTAVITNTNVAASSEVMLTIQSYSGTMYTNGIPRVLRSNTAGSSAGSFTIQLCNDHATNALSGNLFVAFWVLN